LFYPHYENLVLWPRLEKIGCSVGRLQVNFTPLSEL